MGTNKKHENKGFSKVFKTLWISEKCSSGGSTVKLAAHKQGETDFRLYGVPRPNLVNSWRWLDQLNPFRKRMLPQKREPTLSVIALPQNRKQRVKSPTKKLTELHI